MKTLIKLVLLLTSFFTLLAASFDITWNSIEYVINIDDIWRYLSKTFDIWVERYLTIFNDIWRQKRSHWSQKIIVQNILSNIAIYRLVGTKLKGDVIISSSLRLLLKVWVWCRCQNRMEKYYHHDGEEWTFLSRSTTYHKTQAEKRRMFL